MAEQKPNIPTKVHGGQKGAESKLTNIVRISGRDINGEYDIVAALRNIKGISHNLASAIALVTERKYGIKQTETIGSLSEDKLAELETVIKEPQKFGVPLFMLNRRKDIDTGLDLHFVGTDLIVKIKNDMDNGIKLQTWTGFRRQYGQKVRGQRTRSTGRTGRTVGVTKKKIQEEVKKGRSPKPAAGAAPAAAAAPAPAK
jgi:small subunit ribosomal protein S13